MKILVLLEAIVLAGTNVALGQALKDAVLPNPVVVSTRLQLTVGVEHPSLKLGEPVVVHARYKNVSSETVMVGTRHWDEDYALTVSDAFGAEVVLTALGEGWLMRQRGPLNTSSIGPFVLSPGEQGQEFVFDAAKYYQLNHPGTYFVRLILRHVLPRSSSDSNNGRGIPQTATGRSRVKLGPVCNRSVAVAERLFRFRSWRAFRFQSAA